MEYQQLITQFIIKTKWKRKILYVLVLKQIYSDLSQNNLILTQRYSEKKSPMDDKHKKYLK